jgi:hypothetical protein
VIVVDDLVVITAVERASTDAPDTAAVRVGERRVVDGTR